MEETTKTALLIGQLLPLDGTNDLSRFRTVIKNSDFYGGTKEILCYEFQDNCNIEQGINKLKTSVSSELRVIGGIFDWIRKNRKARYGK